MAMSNNSSGKDRSVKNLWLDNEVARYIEACADNGVNEDVASQAYATRLLGDNPHLVLHGGGNTSSKTTVHDLLGDERQVLCIKGSGHDMATIEPSGLPAVELEPLQRLQSKEQLSDEDMVAILRSCLLDSSAPTPSVETLLHAFLPHKFIVHTHASAILSVSNQPDGEAICQEIFATRMANVPYTLSGLALAKKAVKVFAENPDVDGLILHKHGIVTFADTAREAYEQMIEMVGLAEDWIAKAGNKTFVPAKLPDKIATISDVLPIIRGLCTVRGEDSNHKHMICDFRTSDRISDFVNGEALRDYGNRGVVTPDNIIRIKNYPLILPAPEVGDLENFKQAVKVEIAAFTKAYDTYYLDNNARQEISKMRLDFMPRLVLVPGLGLVGLGETARDAAIAADIGEEAINIISDAEAIGRFEALPEETLFEMEYWPLEQAKLKKRTTKPLSGQVVVVTGGAGAIGAACAQLFADNGAEVAVFDLDENAAVKTAARISPHAVGIGGDVTDPNAVRAAFNQVCATFGGVDLVILNAGAAWQGRIGELDDKTLRKSFELNFFSHQNVAQNAVRIMLAQETGGVLMFNTSKQAINPGANFGAYGLPKAATLFLSRQYALEYGKYGIRSNAVNADRIRSGLLTDEMIASRSKARGLSETDYLSGNLLGQEVTAHDVAQAFLHQTLSTKTTADVTTVDGGNIAAI